MPGKGKKCPGKVENARGRKKMPGERRKYPGNGRKCPGMTENSRGKKKTPGEG
ncbi:hypothetical protein [Anaerophaga thermohalophila]|uniref:hypothetical protein n=1 Tax=Anaerophaga thermohalophila TaxID=177400 RepID=UPI000375B653|nr:hypothetical protein [Anaerophaga thermohalophila]